MLLSVGMAPKVPQLAAQIERRRRTSAISWMVLGANPYCPNHATGVTLEGFAVTPLEYVD